MVELLYALVTRGKVVLAEFTTQGGNFPTVTRMLLGKLESAPSASTRSSILYDQYMFHYDMDNHITYMVMTDAAGSGTQRVRVPFAFLDQVKQEFIATYGDRAQSAIAFEFNREFAPVLQRLMERFTSELGNNEPMQRVTDKLESVKGVMVQNIEQILERGEKLELLVDKTEELSTTAFKFQKSSRDLRKAMWLRKMRMYAIVVLVFAVGIWLLTSFICGFDYKKCSSSKDS